MSVHELFPTEPEPPKQDFLCHTFGELFRDFVHQLERGEYDSLGHRLRQCGDDWFDIPLPDDGKEDGA